MCSFFDRSSVQARLGCAFLMPDLRLRERHFPKRAKHIR